MKKLLIITGAGASLDFGMPSVSEIDKFFETWSSLHLPLQENEWKSLYTWVKENVIRELNENCKNGYQEQNFEKTLFTIQQIASISRDNQWGEYNNLNAFINFKPFPEILSHRNKKTADGSDFQTLLGYLIDVLLKDFRKKCIELPKKKSQELELLRSFFNVLKEDFELGFVNLNYDNVILTALPDLKTGFNKKTGEFDTNEFYKPDWNFCYHLHGSVHFDTRSMNGIDIHPIYWQNDLEQKFNPGAGQRNISDTGSGLKHLNSNIITGLDKPNQLLKVPFKQYFGKLDLLANEADAFLFIGYGFNDLYLNKAFPIHRINQKKIKKVTIIDWAPDDSEGMFYRSDNWSNGIAETVGCNAILGNGIDGIPPKVGYYKERKTFEFSPNEKLPLNIWYNGLIEACRNSTKIRDSLI